MFKFSPSVATKTHVRQQASVWLLKTGSTTRRQSQERDQFSSGFCQSVVLASDDRFIYRLLIDRVTSASGWFFSISDVDGHRPEKTVGKNCDVVSVSLLWIQYDCLVFASHSGWPRPPHHSPCISFKVGLCIVRIAL